MVNCFQIAAKDSKTSENTDDSELKDAIKEKIKKSIKDSLEGDIPTINVKDEDEEVTIGPSGIKVKEKNGDDVTIDLYAGETVAVVGESGSGADSVFIDFSFSIICCFLSSNFCLR